MLFKALQLGDVNKVTPVDKSSTILTMVLAIPLLGEYLTVIKSISILLIGVGTYQMIYTKKVSEQKVQLSVISGFYMR